MTYNAALDLLTRLSPTPLPAKLLSEDMGLPVRRRGLAVDERCLLDLVLELRTQHGIAVESQNEGGLSGHCFWIRKADWPRAMLRAKLYLSGKEWG